MAMDLELSLNMSWKDKLLGVGLIASGKEHMVSGNGSDGGLVLLEGDVIRSTVNGILEIDFSNRIKYILYKKMETMVVLKLLGHTIGYVALYNRIRNLWKPSKPFQLMDIENSYYLAKFQNIEDYERVLTQGPWIIYGYVVMAWIRLPGLPGFIYKRRILKAIEGMVGKVAKSYFKIDSRTRGCFSRMTMFINLDRSLVSQVLVNREIQHIEYEALLTICFSCGKYERFKYICPSLAMDPVSESGKEATFELSREVVIRTRVVAETMYGMSMMVEQKSRRGKSNSQGPKDKVTKKATLGSRFTAFFGK
ncbi:hypothetical protein Godav_011246 [Gossypium davidsonii]|uniref:DUF4283 domain-containing protein n=1 Tax=Gossypium davidsonii TaxID=34287 RepID=A0A7J8RAK0_GOSDV|nr:hypothetical protein [Gossypium davidsonii]